MAIHKQDNKKQSNNEHIIKAGIQCTLQINKQEHKQTSNYTKKQSMKQIETTETK